VNFLFELDREGSLSKMDFAFLVEEAQAPPFVQLLVLAGLAQVEPFLAAPYAGQTFLKRSWQFFLLWSSLLNRTWSFD
jgi:hypothetical protein